MIHNSNEEMFREENQADDLPASNITDLEEMIIKKGQVVSPDSSDYLDYLLEKVKAELGSGTDVPNAYQLSPYVINPKPFAKSEEKPATQSDALNYAAVGYTTHTGTAIHTLLGRQLGSFITGVVNFFTGTTSSIDMTPEQIRAMWAKSDGAHHAKEVSTNMWDALEEINRSQPLISHVQNLLTSLSAKVVQELCDRFTPSGYSRVITINEPHLSVSQATSAEILNALNTDISDKLEFYAQRQGMTFSDLIKMATNGQIETLRRLDLPADCRKFLENLYPYVRTKISPSYGFPIDKKYNVYGLKAKPDNILIGVSEGSTEETHRIIELVSKTLKGGYFGKGNFFDPEFITGIEGKVFEEFFRRIAMREISIHVNETKTSTLNDASKIGEISDGHTVDIGHTAAVLQQWAAITIGIRNPRLFPILKSIINSSNESEIDVIIKRSKLTADDKNLIHGLRGMFAEQNQVTLTRITWPILNKYSGIITIPQKAIEPAYVINRFDGASILSWINNAKLAVALRSAEKYVNESRR